MSASGFQPGFRERLPGVQTEFAWDKIGNHSSVFVAI